MWKWIIGIIILFLIWRELYSEPVAITIPRTLTAGDGFNRFCDTIAAGVTEPCGTCFSIHPPLHIIFPVAPPPIQIQKPLPVISQPAPTEAPAPMPVATVQNIVFPTTGGIVDTTSQNTTPTNIIGVACGTTYNRPSSPIRTRTLF